MERIKHWGRSILAAGLVLFLAVPVYGSKTDVDAAREKTVTLEEEKQKVQNTLKSLENLKADTEAYVKELDKSLEELSR